MREITYPAALNGLATDFTRSDFPPQFAASFRNRFINASGGAEKRPGIEKLGSEAPDCLRKKAYHEFVSGDQATLFCSGETISGEGAIWKYDEGAGTWSQVLTGKSPNLMFSCQMNDKLIFFNGVDRNFFTSDNGATFNELKAVSEQGVASGSTNTTTLIDGDIESWTESTFVAAKDIVYNITRNYSGIITAITSAQLTHTVIPGQTAGDRYQIIDTVELNIFGDSNFLDNLADAGTGTTTRVVAVSGVDFSQTEIRVGDYVENTTRNRLGIVTDVSANINLNVEVTAQTVGDTLNFYKSAMPIAKMGAVHYGRLYMIDARDSTKVRITGPGDPQDLTTQVTTLDTKTFAYGSQTPDAEELKTIKTFQRFIVFCGSRNVITYEGDTPIQDATSTSINFSPVSLSPQGLFSRLGVTTDGNNLYFASKDGLQSLAITFDARALSRQNASEPIKNRLRALIDLVADQDDVQLILYPRRNWVMMKVADRIFNYNYGSFISDGGQIQVQSSWSLFDGLFAQQKAYFVRNNGDMVLGGTGGQTYIFDTGVYSDDGAVIPTEYKTGFLSGEEPRRTLRVKKGTYIKPYFEIGSEIQYTIRVVAGFDAASSDEVVVTAKAGGAVGTAVVGLTPIGGTGVDQQKVPLRWRGEQFQLTITSENTVGPDVFSQISVYLQDIGVK